MTRALRRGGRSCAAILAGVAAATATAPGGTAHAASRTLTTTRLEARIVQSIRRKNAIGVAVRCPGRVPAVLGYRFTCVARLAVGTYSLHVRETDAHGTMYFYNHRPLRVLDSARVAGAIERAVRAQRGLMVRVNCPSPILQRPGLRFHCVARGAGILTVFRVTEQRGGFVRFVGQ